MALKKYIIFVKNVERNLLVKIDLKKIEKLFVMIVKEK